MHWRAQGDRGELLAMEWFTGAGATLCLPFGRSPHYDFVADFGTRLIRVQVKTSTVAKRGRYEAQVCTKGGNQSWSGVTKLLDPTLFDELFVVVADGRRWRIPADQIGGTVALLLGGPKYASYEVSSGPPLFPDSLAAPLQSPPPARRGDTQAVNGTRL